jgi:hypothetical protein
MDESAKGIFKTAICAWLLSSAALAGAQPSPGLPPKGEKPEPAFNFDSRKGEDSRKSEEARRDAAAAKAAIANKKSSSSSSKSRSAEIRSLAFSDSSLRANRPLVISQKHNGKTRDQLRMDLLVMCRILEKAAREHVSEVHKAAGIDLLALSGANRSVRTMYLDNYGAIFTLNVRLPLRSQAEVEEPEVRESSNEEWEETRNELFGQKRRVRRVSTANRPQYNESDVQELKRELLDALKNAANIRNLEPNDFVTIAVIGPAEFEAEVLQIEAGRGDETRRMVVPNFEAIEDADVQTSSESMMIIWAQKKNLDEAAQNNWGAEEFAKIVSVSVH